MTPTRKPDTHLALLAQQADNFATHWMDDDDPEDHARAVKMQEAIRTAETAVRAELSAAHELRRDLAGTQRQLDATRAAASATLAALQACEGALSSYLDGNTAPSLDACNAIRDHALQTIAQAEAAGIKEDLT